MNCKFSIIMPCYNSQEYVINALNSIVNQTYSNWELIAVNDGSTDNTQQILEEFASKDSRIKIYSKENGGYCSAVNAGLEQITGDYFLMLGSDDSLGIDLFEKLAPIANKDFPDCIYYRTVMIRDGEIVGVDTLTDFQDEVFVFDISFAEFSESYSSHGGGILSYRDTSKCYKRSLLGDLRYFGKYGIGADDIFSMLFCRRARSFAGCPVDGYFWTLRSNSLSAKEQTMLQQVDVVETWLEFYTRLLSFEVKDITCYAKIKLNWFLYVIGVAWKNSRPFFKDYSLTQRALKTARRFIRKNKKSPPPAYG